MAITGAHSVIYSKDAEADRAFFRDVLRFPFVDAHEGWLIFGLPPAEGAVHPGEANDEHEFFLMCDDINAFVAVMKAKNVEWSDFHQQPWGMLGQITLPAGGKLDV